ncbi:TonB family protein [bacterium]|nr:TonB family protein [bacterium]
MSILGNINRLLDEEENNNGAYTTPAVIRDNKDYISFKKAFVMSTLLHPAVVCVIWLITFALMLLGIDLFMLNKPKPKMNDIEFVLVEKEATPINKKTPYRADINSRAGGKHDPTRKVSMPSPKPAKTQKAKPAAAPAAKKAPAKKVTPQQPVKKQAAPAQKASSQPAKTTTAPKPAPPSVKPSAKPVAAPKVTTTPKTNFNVPVPPSANKGSLSTGPVGGSGTAQKSAGGSYSPTPSLAPTYKSSNAGAGTSAGSRGTSASRGGSGNYGNPGPGNPNGRPGIDAIAAPDFGPYMRDLQRRIKMNWDPPKGNESKRVVLLFKIARDGRLLSCTVHKSSGLQAADNAAINAVKLTAPFKPLPANFQGQSVDIQFTFDYNVFGGSYR